MPLLLRFVFCSHNRRYRSRVYLMRRGLGRTRGLRAWLWSIRHEQFPQGDVWRVWAGWLFVTVLVDA